ATPYQYWTSIKRHSVSLIIKMSDYYTALIMKFINITILITCAFIILPMSVAKAETSSLIITEIQTGSLESASEEFIEIYNPSNSPLNLEGIVVQYKSANGSSWQSKSELSGWVDSKSFVLIATESYFEEVNFTFDPGLSGAGGHIRIYHKE